MPTVRRRKIIVNVATSADGFIARTDGDIEWLTRRPAPKGFYGLPKFERLTDARILGRKTFDLSVELGARFSAKTPHFVFSRRPAHRALPPGVHFVSKTVQDFASELTGEKGKNVWLMGGGEIIASFLDAKVIDEFIITVVPTFIGEGIPLIAPGHRDVSLQLLSTKPFADDVVQLHYRVLQ